MTYKNRGKRPPAESVFSVTPRACFDFGFTEHMSSPNPIALDLTVETFDVGCSIASIKITGPAKTSFRFLHWLDKLPFDIHADRVLTMPLLFCPPCTIGLAYATLSIKFLVSPSAKNKRPFFKNQKWTLYGTVGSSHDVNTFSARQPYEAPQKMPWRPPMDPKKLVKAPKDKNASMGKIKFVAPLLPQHDCPPWLRSLLAQGSVEEQVATINSHLPTPDNYGGYGAYWSVLLQAERVQEELEVRNYDLLDAELTKSGKSAEQTYYLQVPGLAEKRPSVLRGDKIKVNELGGDKVWYEGLVTKVELTRVALRFKPNFRPSASATFEVRFSINSVQPRRMLDALSKPLPPPELLFPTPGASRPGKPSSDVAAGHPGFFNTLIEQNPHQREAVLSIYHGASGAAPSVLYGPPGTGKTVTLIETCKQLLRYQLGSRLLLTAPSNTAADLFCERLGGDYTFGCLKPHELPRLNAPPREPADVKPRVLEYSCQTGGEFICPPLDEIEKYRVVVATCASTSLLAGLGMSKGHFSHICIDEAGQATEPLASESTGVILAGDPKQLGPVIRSSVAGKLGLEKSFLERLMDHPDYLDSNHSTRGTTYTKLVLNYRNHASILDLPNRFFYLGELEARATPQVTETLISWTGWKTRGFPILFHAVRGKDEREGKSPSFFNVSEITVVKDYVRQLKEKASLADHEIGVIAPCTAQGTKLKAALNRPKLTVGSVEQFQGSERSLIIISTTRSSPQHLSHDTKFGLGFLANPGLIVVGDPDLLAVDPMWRAFLLYVFDNGGWAGQDWDAAAYRNAEE
ncbi:hypothetical protein JCM11641_004004 [Rhodosporidiobolus odoratus]